MSQSNGQDEQHADRPIAAAAAGEGRALGRRLLVGAALLAAVLLAPLAFVWVMLTVARGAVWAAAEMREHIAATGWVVLVLILIWLAVEVRMMMRAGRDGAAARSMPRRRRIGACLGCAAIMVMGNGALEIASSRVEAHWEARKRDGVDLYRNHDLSRLVGQCVRLSLLRHAETIGPAGVRRELVRLAEAAPDRWEALAAEGDARVMRLGDAQLSGFILKPDAAALSAEDFGALLRDWQARSGPSTLSQAELDAAAAAISRDLGITLREALKSDFQRGGKAWAAMQLDLAQSLLAALSAETGSADTAAAIADLSALVADHAAALPALSDLLSAVAAADERHARAVLERFDATAAQLARLEETTRAIREDTIALREDTAALRGDTAALRGDASTIVGTLEDVLSSVKDVSVLQRELNDRFVAQATIGQRGAASSVAPAASADPQAAARSAADAAQIEADFAAYEAARRTTGSRPFFVETAPLRSRLWEREARAGNPAAAVLMGRTMQEGIGMEPNLPAARAWFEQAADAGSAAGLFNLALMHESGQGGFPQSRAAAVRLHMAAAELGHEGAMCEVGRYTQHGWGGLAANPQAALVWYERAIALGDTHSMNSAAYLYLHGTEARSADPDAALALFRRSAQAGNEEARGVVAASTLGEAFVAYAAEEASATDRQTALALARASERNIRSAPIDTLINLLQTDPVAIYIQRIDAGPVDDPMRLMLDDVRTLTIDRFAAADLETRRRLFDRLARVAADFIWRWTQSGEHHRVAALYRNACREIPLAPRTNGDQQQTAVLARAFAVSLYAVGYRADAAAVADDAFVMIDAILAERPWDWYLKDAAGGLAFAVAQAAADLGDHDQSQQYLKRAWTLMLVKFGKEGMLEKYQQLPLKGKVPPNATEEDRKFFERFGPSNTASESGMTRFTIPAQFGSVSYPFHVYILSGPRGYIELQDQFIWLREYRSGIIPRDVEDSFRRLAVIAVENNVDFRDLCIYALGTAAKIEEASPVSVIEE